jgi:mannose-6-phosphate isomerase-like protein (cupin superfamily)
MRRIMTPLLILTSFAAGAACAAVGIANAAAGIVPIAAQQASPANPPSNPPNNPPSNPPNNPLAASRVFAYNDMATTTAANGSVRHNAFSGTLATGEAISAHESMQPAGTAPGPAHRIQHSELIVVEEGTLEYTHDGKTDHAGAGSIIYVALGTLHSVRNVGDGPAKYVVFQIGGDTGK